MYSAPPTQPGQYNTQGHPMMSYRPEGSYPKTEMAPPALREVPDESEVKPNEGMMPQGSNQVAPPSSGPEGDNEHDNEYTHSNASYNGNRGPYGYPNAPSGPVHPEHAHLSPEMTGSPHQNGTGRSTPRTTTTSQSQWNGYPTSQRPGAPSSNLYNVMSDPRGAPNGNGAHDAYPGPGAVPQYANQGYPATNGVNAPSKRGRDEEDDDYRPDSVQSDDMGGLKRRKTMEGGAVGGAYPQDPNPGIQRAHTMATQRARR